MQKYANRMQLSYNGSLGTASNWLFSQLRLFTGKKWPSTKYNKPNDTFPLKVIC